MQVKYASLPQAAKNAIVGFGIKWHIHVAYWSPKTCRVYQYQMGHLPDMVVNGIPRSVETSSDVPYNGIGRTWHSMLPVDAALVVL